MPDLQAAHLVDLMSHTALGNHQAFAELYDLTVRRVYGRCCGCCAHRITLRR